MKETTKARPQIQANFIAQTIGELKKVTWPTRIQTIRLTLIVIGISLIIGMYLGILDILLAKLLEVLTKAR